MFWFLMWIVLSYLVAWVGADRKIGWWGTFLLSLLLSPLIGLIFALISKSTQQESYEKKLMESQKSQLDSLQKIASKTVGDDIPTQLQKLQRLKDSGAISDEEYQKLKQKIISQ